MSGYVEPERLKKKVTAVTELVDLASNNDVKYLRSTTLTKYDEIAEDLLSSYVKLKSLTGSKLSKSIDKYGHSVSHSNVYTLSKRIFELPKECKEANLQDFIQVLVDWYSHRYGDKNPNSSFHYKSEKIPQYIDKLIVCYGFYAHKSKLPEFYKGLSDWYLTLKDHNYPLPKFVYSSSYESIGICPESVVIENGIKKSLYKENFFSEYSTTLIDEYRLMWGDVTFEEIEAKSLLR